MRPRDALRFALLGASGSVLWARPAMAHGIGGRSDLPLPLWQVAYGAAAVLVVSFVALGRIWPEPRLEDRAEGRPLPRPVSQLGKAFGIPGRALALAIFALVWVAAAFGTTDPSANLAPVAIYVVLWVGGMAVSALLGDVWHSLSPFDTLGRGVLAIATRLGLRQRAYRLGHWPAAAFLAGFLWLELVYHEPASPRVLALAIGAYTAAVMAGTIAWGLPWLRGGEAFSAFFGLLAAMAPLHRGVDGRRRMRAPFRGLALLAPQPGTVAVVMVALGATAFDGLSRTQTWGNLVGDRTGWAATAVGTAGLAWSVAVVVGLYMGAMQLSARLLERDRGELGAAFVHSIVPIALAYAIAHYFSLFVFEGQSAVALMSDPLGRGWDLFGTATNRVDYTVVSTGAIAYVQTGAIVAGHVLGVVLAHDRAVATIPRRLVAASQYPLLAAMVAFTMGGLFLLFGG